MGARTDRTVNGGLAVLAAAALGAGVVHASFNIGDQPAKLLAILGPCVGEGGYELVDVADQAPWNTLRA